MFNFIRWLFYIESEKEIPEKKKGENKGLIVIDRREIKEDFENLPEQISNINVPVVTDKDYSLEELINHYYELHGESKPLKIELSRHEIESVKKLFTNPSLYGYDNFIEVLITTVKNSVKNNIFLKYQKPENISERYKNLELNAKLGHIRCKPSYGNFIFIPIII